MSENEVDITPQDRGEKIPVQTIRKFCRIIVADVREERKQFELTGMMEIPLQVYLGQIKLNWNFDTEMSTTMKGIVTDVCAEGANMVFIIAEDDDVLNLEGKPLTFDEILDIFKKYHPTFELERKI